MAVPANTYTRFTANTNVREDLIDKITMTNPEETPVVSSFGTGTAENTYHEWQRDNLRAANKDNAALDGDDATASAKTPPQRVANVCQIFQDTIQVSGRAEAVKKAGMKKALAYHKAKAYKELQRDIEAAALSENPAVAGSAGVASKLGGLGVMIYTNALHGGAGATAAHTSGAPTTAVTAGTNRAFTETLFKSAIQATYTASGKVPPMAVMSPSHKSIFSAFTGIAANRVNLPGKTGQGVVVGGADVYVSPGATYDTLDLYSPTMDGLPNIGFDSQFWLSGGRSLSVFNTSHQLQSLTGESASSGFVTGDVGDDDVVLLLQGIRLRFARAPVSASIQTRSSMNSGSEYMDGPSGAMNDGKFDCLLAARWHRAAAEFVGTVTVTHMKATYTQEGTR